MIDGLKNYKNNSLDAMGSPEITATLLKKSGTHMGAAKRAIEAGEIEKRVRESEVAITILGGLEGALSHEDSAENPMVQTLKTFYDTMSALITRMNINNDLKLAEAIEKSLFDMAQCWEEVGQKLKEQSGSRLEAPAEVPTGPSLQLGA